MKRHACYRAGLGTLVCSGLGVTHGFAWVQVTAEYLVIRFYDLHQTVLYTWRAWRPMRRHEQEGPGHVLDMPESGEKSAAVLPHEDGVKLSPYGHALMGSPWLPR